MIIEFVGLPASGKSTLAAALEQELARLGTPVSHPAPASLPRGAVAMFRYPVLSASAVLGLLIGGRTLRDRWFFLRRVIFALRIWEVARQKPTQVVIIHEGLRQRAMSAFTATSSSTRLAKVYGSHGPPPDVLVRLRMDPALFEQRQALRDQPISDLLANQSPERRLMSLGLAQDVLDACCAGMIANNPDVAVVDVPADDFEVALSLVRREVVPLAHRPG